MKRDSLFVSIKSALLIALIIASSYLYLPLPSLSGLSLQTVFINLTALMLSPVQGLAAIAVWIIMGAAGLPVFSGAGGLGKLFGVTGGYYLGFLIAVPLMSMLKGKEKKFPRYFSALLVGLLTEHICAVAVMCLHTGSDISAAFTSISLPFIPGDILKCFLSALIAVKLAERKFI